MKFYKGPNPRIHTVAIQEIYELIFVKIFSIQNRRQIGLISQIISSNSFKKGICQLVRMFNVRVKSIKKIWNFKVNLPEFAKLRTVFNNRSHWQDWLKLAVNRTIYHDDVVSWTRYFLDRHVINRILNHVNCILCILPNSMTEFVFSMLNFRVGSFIFSGMIDAWKIRK